MTDFNNDSLVFSKAEREAIRRLAQDIPALWHDPKTKAAERKEILRQVIETIQILVIEDSERVRVEIHWAGGHISQLETIRPVARFEQLSYYPDLCDLSDLPLPGGRQVQQAGARQAALGNSPRKPSLRHRSPQH